MVVWWAAGGSWPRGGSVAKNLEVRRAASHSPLARKHTTEDTEDTEESSSSVSSVVQSLDRGAQEASGTRHRARETHAHTVDSESHQFPRARNRTRDRTRMSRRVHHAHSRCSSGRPRHTRGNDRTPYSVSSSASSVRQRLPRSQSVGSTAGPPFCRISKCR